MVSTDPKSNTGSAIAAKVGSQATRSPGQKGSTGLDVASDASKTPVGTSVSESAGSSGGGSSYREGSGNPADAFDFMKSAYFVVVISLSIILGVIILIFVTRYARRQYAKGHLDNHPIKIKKTKELSADIERLQYKSFGEIDCDPVLLSESITGIPVREEIEKNYYYRMKALDQIHDLDACIAKSCKTDNPLVLQQVARVARSDLKNYFRKARDPISIGVHADSRSGGSSKKRHLRVSVDDSSNRKTSLGVGLQTSAYTTQGPLWGTNIELTKKFRIEYDVARFGPPVTFNRERYAQYIEALNNLKQSIEQSKTAKPKRGTAVSGSIAPASMFGSPPKPTISSFDDGATVTILGAPSGIHTGSGGIGAPNVSSIRGGILDNSRSPHQNSFFRAMAAPSATIAATVAGYSHSRSRLLAANGGTSNSSYTKFQQHRKQQKSKLSTHYTGDLLQLSVTPTQSTTAADQSTSVFSAKTTQTTSKGTNLSMIPTSNNFLNSRTGGRSGIGAMSSSGGSTRNEGSEGIAAMDESSDTDNTVERIPLLQPVPHSHVSTTKSPSTRSETTSKYDSAITRV